MRDITKRKLLRRVSAAASEARRESCRSRYAQKYTATRASAPHTAPAIRHPNELSPAAFMPIAMINFPQGGFARGGGAALAFGGPLVQTPPSRTNGPPS